MGLRSASGGERGDRIKKVPPWKCQPKDGEQLGAPRQYNTVNLTYLGPTVKDQQQLHQLTHSFNHKT